MTTNLKVLLSAAGAAALGVALFVFFPANSDLRDPGNARFAQDDSRDPHSSRFAQGSGLYGDPDERDPANARFAQDDARDPHTTRFAHAKVDVRDPVSPQGNYWDRHTTRFTYTNSDARDPANAGLAQDDNRDLHLSRFVVGVVVERTPG
jgi:hypothetical protein